MKTNHYRTRTVIVSLLHSKSIVTFEPFLSISDYLFEDFLFSSLSVKKSILNFSVGPSLDTFSLTWM